MATGKKKLKRRDLYDRTINDVFHTYYKPRLKRFEFTRADLLNSMTDEGLDLSGDDKAIAKNIGDIIYSYRFRKDFPQAILDTAPKGKMWIITGKGDARYEFRLITEPSMAADPNWHPTKLHDATPEIVRRFALNDEQAALARIRYNRLVDLFCKCVAHSLQNHLRTKIQGVGQIEIDELYVGANRRGEHFIIPVQVKRESDRLGVSQLLQDLEYCRTNHPSLTPRAIGAQMMEFRQGSNTYDRIAVFEFNCEDRVDDVFITKIAERHFVLLPHRDITDADLDRAKTDADPV